MKDKCFICGVPNGEPHIESPPTDKDRISALEGEATGHRKLRDEWQARAEAAEGEVERLRAGCEAPTHDINDHNCEDWPPGAGCSGCDGDEIRTAALQGLPVRIPVHIVFDGPSAPESGRFIEVENSKGEGLSVGEWRERADGFWELVITELPYALRGEGE